MSDHDNDRDELDALLCEAYPDQVGFSVSDVLDVVLPWHAAKLDRALARAARIARGPVSL